MKRFLKLSVLVAALAAGISFASPINVLWYGVNTSYNSQIQNLAALAPTWDPAGDGSLSWNLSFWNAGDALPDFSSYDVLVIGSGGNGFFSGWDGTRLLDAGDEIAAARGTRTFLSGQDADWHFMNSPKTPAEGFLVDAVDWAGSGNGLGIVSLTDGWQGNQNNWWTKDGSFLQDELASNVGYFQEESVVIPAATQGFAVNEGLTTASLSNWGVSSHSAYFKTTIDGYTSINDAGNHPGWAVTIVTEATAGGGTQGGGDPASVPEPATIVLLGMGLLAFIGFRKK